MSHSTGPIALCCDSTNALDAKESSTTKSSSCCVQERVCQSSRRRRKSSDVICSMTPSGWAIPPDQNACCNRDRNVGGRLWTNGANQRQPSAQSKKQDRHMQRLCCKLSVRRMLQSLRKRLITIVVGGGGSPPGVREPFFLRASSRRYTSCVANVRAPPGSGTVRQSTDLAR